MRFEIGKQIGFLWKHQGKEAKKGYLIINLSSPILFKQCF